tara:strand:+ start:1797 stop:2039 length:243 start_codon:yes stop_codon:yes gene_type:complete
MKYHDLTLRKIRYVLCIECVEQLDLLEDDVCSRNFVDSCDAGFIGYIEHRCLSHGDLRNGEYLYKGSEDYNWLRSLIDGG